MGLAIAGWLACFVAILVFLGRLNALVYLQLMREGAPTKGVVIAREPLNHDSVVVRYAARGAEYVTYSSFVATPNPQKSMLRVGDEVTVYFLPRNPQTATIGDPRYLLPNELSAIGLAATIFPTLLVGAVLWRTRTRRTGR